MHKWPYDFALVTWSYCENKKYVAKIFPTRGVFHQSSHCEAVSTSHFLICAGIFALSLPAESYKVLSHQYRSRYSCQEGVPERLYGYWLLRVV